VLLFCTRNTAEEYVYLRNCSQHFYRPAAAQHQSSAYQNFLLRVNITYQVLVAQCRGEEESLSSNLPKMYICCSPLLLVFPHFRRYNHILCSWNSFMKVIAREPTLRRSVACLSSRKLVFNPRPVKVNVKWSRYRPGVAQRVGRDIAVLFRDRGTRMRWVTADLYNVIFRVQNGTARIFPPANRFSSVIVFALMVHARVSFIIQRSNKLIWFGQSEEHDALFFGISWDMMGDVLTLSMQPLYISPDLKKA